MEYKDYKEIDNEALFLEKHFYISSGNGILEKGKGNIIIREGEDIIFPVEVMMVT